MVFKAQNPKKANQKLAVMYRQFFVQT